ncbi:MAG: hypothetical protein QMD92_00245 [bacterium]|nr:hypothetical protein [bacterium]
MADKEEEWLISKEKTRKKRFVDATIKAGLMPGPSKPKPKEDKEADEGKPAGGWRKHLEIVTGTLKGK